MKLTHLIGTNFFGGPERQILTHSIRIREQGFEPQIVSFHEGGKVNDLLAQASSHGLPCRELKPWGPFHPGSVMELCQELRTFGSEVLIGHGYKANVVGRLASWFSGIPFIAVSRGWTSESSRIRLYEALDRIFLRLADAVIAVSDGQRRKILACGVPARKVRVIHNAVDLKSFPAPNGKGVRDELGIPEKAVLVVTAGRLSPEKNHRGLIDAATRVLSMNKDVWFVVFGEGFLRSNLEDAIAEAGIEGRFLLPGFRPDVRSLFHEADIFALPSLTEGLPNVILEAFACGKPVVATSVGGTPEVVRQGRDGILVPAGEMGMFADALLRLAGDPALRESMGRSGFEHVGAAFDYSSQTEAYRQVYCDVLMKRHGMAEGRA